MNIHKALSFLVDEGGVELLVSFQADLRWFKNLRNDVEHFQFELDAPQVRGVIARLLYDADLVLHSESICPRCLHHPDYVKSDGMWWPNAVQTRGL